MSSRKNWKIFMGKPLSFRPRLNYWLIGTLNENFNLFIKVGKFM
ncbi:MAG: hypothetical protein BAJALOKI3v1_280009 [Promethearchaeota archaeon]|nr:MAG: hypothetical protein BAJALOKI3v1_280009 [Candidatus Lokiarchaeota archaeon]